MGLTVHIYHRLKMRFLTLARLFTTAILTVIVVVACESRELSEEESEVPITVENEELGEEVVALEQASEAEPRG